MLKNPDQCFSDHQSTCYILHQLGLLKKTSALGGKSSTEGMFVGDSAPDLGIQLNTNQMAFESLNSFETRRSLQACIPRSTAYVDQESPAVAKMKVGVQSLAGTAPSQRTRL